MNLTPEELKKLGLPLLAALALLGAGAGLIWGANEALKQAQRVAAAAQAERQQNGERLARIAEEEREVKEKIDVYQRLKALNILGEERRLEWADAMTRIRTQRELLDLRYRVERQRLLVSAAGQAGQRGFLRQHDARRARAAARGGPAALPRRPARLGQRVLRGAQLHADAHRRRRQRRPPSRRACAPIATST